MSKSAWQLKPFSWGISAEQIRKRIAQLRKLKVQEAKSKIEIGFPTVWINSDLSLFRIDNDGLPEYMSCAGVFRVMQRRDGWHVILSGYLPISLNLFNAGGETFEVCYIPCGPRAVYDCDACIMRFSNCKLVRKWIPRLISYDGDMEVVCGHVELSCDVWVSEGE